VLIEARDVTRRYDVGAEIVTALADVDLTVETGEFVAVVGPSGSGKSTLLNVIGLLDTPTEGTVLVDGVDSGSLSDTERTALRRETIGFVFQSFYLIPTLSARENVALPRLFGLGDRTEHRPPQLSGGQQQRVAIARSLINEPGLLLADEPTGNLDQTTGRQILREFQAITREGVSVVAVTHDRLVTDHADRVVELVDGRLYESSRETEHVS
jgi:putative ABC transport system ATP-binding protein